MRRSALARSAISLLMLAFATMALPSCASVPSKRVQELLVRKGFGKRASGDAQVANYATVRAQIQFFVSPELLADPAFADLVLLAVQPQPVTVDGTIYIPGYGPSYVLGMTGPEIGALVTEQLQAFYKPKIRIRARILAAPRLFWVLGETLAPGFREFIGDLTVAEAVLMSPRSPVANIGKIRLIRADPKNPLVVTINLHEIVVYGYSTYNLNIKENDIIYIPPTFFGQVSRFIERLTYPLTTVLSVLFQYQTLDFHYKVLTGDQEFFFGNRFLY